jgi:AAA15 family ATPase/GTPase
MTMQFTRVQLGNWKNFTHVDVALARRAFIVGPNASGKSNLLDALRFLRDLAEVLGRPAPRRRGRPRKPTSAER